LNVVNILFLTYRDLIIYSICGNL